MEKRIIELIIASTPIEAFQRKHRDSGKGSRRRDQRLHDLEPAASYTSEEDSTEPYDCIRISSVRNEVFTTLDVSALGKRACARSNSRSTLELRETHSPLGHISRCTRHSPLGHTSRCTRHSPLGHTSRCTRHSPLGHTSRCTRHSPLGHTSRCTRHSPQKTSLSPQGTSSWLPTTVRRSPV